VLSLGRPVSVSQVLGFNASEVSSLAGGLHTLLILWARLADSLPSGSRSCHGVRARRTFIPDLLIGIQALHARRAVKNVVS